MRLLDHPQQPVDPYPAPGTRIRRFRYGSALVLMRAREAPKRRIGADANFVLGRNFDVDWWPEGEEACRRITVPAGLVTDLTSVPRLFRSLVDRVGPWLEAAILHDYLYVAWQDVPGRGPRRADRRFADDMMLAAMLEARVWPAKAHLIHGAVTLFGGRAYARRNEERYAELSDPDLLGDVAFTLPPAA